MISLLLFSLAASPSASPGAAPDALGQNLFCLCGCAQTVASCPHPNCAEYDPARGVYGRKYLEEDLAAFRAAGLSNEAILSEMAEKYGERVLTIPRARGLGIWAWIAPGIALLAGLGAVVWFLAKERAATEE